MCGRRFAWLDRLLAWRVVGLSSGDEVVLQVLDLDSDWDATRLGW